MSSTSIALPRGLILGACFAILLAAPLFFAISLDSASPAFPRRFQLGNAQNPRPWPVTSNAAFFNGQVNVRVSMVFRPTGGLPATRTTDSSEPSAKTDSGQLKMSRVFQIRIENRSNQELSIDVLRANSEFGELSPGLQMIRLTPGQMTQTGVALNETAIPTKPLPVEVTLRLGDREETRELILVPAAQPGQWNRE